MSQCFFRPFTTIPWAHCACPGLLSHLDIVINRLTVQFKSRMCRHTIFCSWGKVENCSQSVSYCMYFALIFGKVENNLNSWVFKFAISIHGFHMFMCVHTHGTDVGHRRISAEYIMLSSVSKHGGFLQCREKTGSAFIVEKSSWPLLLGIENRCQYMKPSRSIWNSVMHAVRSWLLPDHSSFRQWRFFPISQGTLKISFELCLFVICHCVYQLRGCGGQRTVWELVLSMYWTEVIMLGSKHSYLLSCTAAPSQGTDSLYKIMLG